MDEISLKFKFCEHQHCYTSFCSDCYFFLCKNCQINHHNFHEITEINNFMANFPNYLTKIIDFFSENLQKFPNIDENKLKISRKLDEVYEEIIKSLLNSKQILKDKILFSLNFEEAVNKKLELDSFFKILKEKLEKFFVDDKKNDKDHFFSMIKQINLQEIHKKIEEINSISLQNNVDYFVNYDFTNKTNENFNKFVKEINKIFEKSLLRLSERSEIVNLNQIDFVLNEIDRLLNKKNEYILLYRGSQEGFSAEKFHLKCNYKRPLLVIVKSEFKKVFGGFSDAQFVESQYNIFQPCNKNMSFIFSVDKRTIHKILDNKEDKANRSNNSSGPCFGEANDIKISNNSCGFITYEAPNNIKKNSIEAKEFLSGADNSNGEFKVLEYEVWLCK